MGTDYLEKMQRYREALEEERRKILFFQRELPLCLELVTQGLKFYGFSEQLVGHFWCSTSKDPM